MQPLLRVNNITKSFGAVQALKGISLTLFRGEIVGLLGVNGAGKTTLSSIIATLNPESEGDIIWKNKSIYSDVNNYRRVIGLCPQRANLLSELTVKENLELAGKCFDMAEASVQAKVKELAERFCLGEYLTSKPGELSGGYKQRVLIARALMHSPKLVILDEPTVGLDPHMRHELWETIRRLKRDGVTVLLTTHYLDEAEILSDRIVIRDKGLIRLIDTPDGLKNAYQTSRLEDVFLQLMKEEAE